MQELQERIRENIKVSPDTSCWLWQLGKGSFGYGQIRYRKRLYRTHRAAYTAFNGEIPEGAIVRHTCDVRSCCNPDHLLLGTQQDNMVDMVQRQRSTSQLTWEIVKNIRKETKMSYRELALKYGVSKSTAYNIRNNKTWREE